MINTAPPASNSVYGREKLFWYDKRADKPGSAPGVFLFGLFFKNCFSFWPFFLYSYCWPCWSCTWINIYFKLKSGVLFWKRDFKSSWSAYWPSLRPDKNHKPCQDMSLLWNSWILTHSTPQTVLIYTHHPPVTHWRKLNLPFVHRLNHQYYYPKISTGFAPKK